jgi:hypothetical protein
MEDEVSRAQKDEETIIILITRRFVNLSDNLDKNIQVTIGWNSDLYVVVPNFVRSEFRIESSIVPSMKSYLRDSNVLQLLNCEKKILSYHQL